ncbi:MAG TPA: TlpA disulfide reductase family protein [Pseudomonas sp.]|jgi:thiol-disulfide isomerase/thioredoxin|nr:TlpA disulfide reductase family protein [Pseudomonas sp.]
MKGWKCWALGLCLALGGCGEADLGPDQHGSLVTSESLRGQWLVINYWAEWCAPCRKEIPELNALASRIDGVRVLGVNFDGLQGEALRKAADGMGIAFTVLADNPAERFRLPPTGVLPVTYLVDEQGKVRERLLGEQTAEGLVARLKALREES